ncbi:MAG: 2-dehydro-3-deoxyphosphogluconate aldolase, partial [Lentisphaeria bacterium]|nr:2-dehydro-3-deoxyphosphogluconate aldolase [Lentisphaeria bacterium]
FMKFFPAEAAGGVSYLKAVSAPYKHLGIRFMPTGGVTSSNVSDYLGMSEVAAVGGTWLGKATDIAAGNWDGIEDAIRKAVALIKDLSK